MRAIQCPNCGAPCDMQARKCSYCGSTFSVSNITGAIELTGRVCPACSTINPPDARKCGDCATTILEPCRTCKRLIATSSKHCVYCGILHHSSSPNSGCSSGFREAIELSEIGSFPDADALFSELEKNNTDSEEFYAAWITNYMKWAMSFDNDATIRDFARQYRNKASELLHLIEDRFPGSACIDRSRQFINSNININTKPDMGKPCFVATAVYGDALHPEVVVLRAWRDTVLVKSRPGQQFVRIYGVVGPFLAAVVGRSQYAKYVCRRLISVVVRCLIT